MIDVFLVPPAANISSCARWNQNGTTIAGNQNGRCGSNLSMLCYPSSIHINRFDNTLYVGDNVNKRVIGVAKRYGISFFHIVKPISPQ
jgi:hypothetical protein